LTNRTDTPANRSLTHALAAPGCRSNHNGRFVLNLVSTRRDKRSVAVVVLAEHLERRKRDARLIGRPGQQALHRSFADDAPRFVNNRGGLGALELQINENHAAAPRVVQDNSVRHPRPGVTHRRSDDENPLLVLGRPITCKRKGPEAAGRATTTHLESNTKG
jgi:hypothetical protein